MRRALSAVVLLSPLLAALPAALAAQPVRGVESIPDSRIDRLTAWVQATALHHPGVGDQQVDRIRDWTSGDLRALLDDAMALVTIVEKHRTHRFFVTGADYRRVELGYTKPQLTRMRRLACAAGGLVEEDYCTALGADQPTDPAIARLAAQALAARRAGDRNYFLRRASMLHTDVATLTEPRFSRRSVNPSTALRLDDGRGEPVLDPAEHWELARRLLDHVVPAGEDKPAPARDPMVREWYVATSAWLEGNERHRTGHLDRARALFPDDPDLLFLSGCQHEVYATPEVQAAVSERTRRPGVRLPVESGSRELELAERFLRHALAIQPDMNEARLHLGHVLLVERRHADARLELGRVESTGFAPDLRYYLALFTGAAAEAVGQRGAARDAYEAASRLFPSAQSAYIALSALAWRAGDAPAALGVFERMLAGTRDDPDSDPWWTYDTSDVRDPDARLDTLRRALAGDRP